MGVEKGQPQILPCDRWDTVREIMQLGKAIWSKSLGSYFNVIFISLTKKTSDLTEGVQGRRRKR